MGNIDKIENKTVVVGMSGGVDSSVVAYLLKKQGYRVIGLHMKGANDETALDDEMTVRGICSQLGIECHVVEYANEMQIVKNYFIDEYKNGRTPNPCVICNQMIKFKPFIEFAEKIGADYFATGHYARIEHDGDDHILKVAKDAAKDQTYFLNQLSNRQLSKALFPLGDLDKASVRDIAKTIGLANAEKKDSYDICFLGSEKFKDFMSKNYPEKSGDIVDQLTGNVVGVHSGLNKYTIGQRKGLGIGGGYGKTLDAWFVTDKDVKTNTLFVAQGNDDVLYSDSLIATNFNWISKIAEGCEFDCEAKFRYRQSPQCVRVKILDNDKVQINFYEKQRAVTTGQFAVLYKETSDGCLCLGGGKIERVIKNNKEMGV